MKSNIVKLDIEHYPVEVLIAISRELKRLFYSQSGPLNDHIQDAIGQIYDEIQSRKIEVPIVGDWAL